MNDRNWNFGAWPAFLVWFALSVYATVQAIAEPQPDPGMVPAVLQSAETKRGLNFSLGDRGLGSLSFDGQSLLASPQGGELQPAKSLFRAAVDTLLNSTASPPAIRNRETGNVDLTYPWGVVSCAYSKKGDNGITMCLSATNSTGEAIPDVSIRLLELNFPSVPEGMTLDAGMFGYGFKGTASPMGNEPLMVGSRFAVPIIAVNFAGGALNFCCDDLEGLIEISRSSNAPARTNYPLMVGCRDIKPNSTKTFNVSLRFGPAGSTVNDLSGDVLQAYREKYPFSVKWNDHRAIGAIYLASSGIKVTTNPRRWIMNSGNIDVTTEEGRASFRATLLSLADNSIKILKDTNAQGMITWDPEGQEFRGATYYGDPRLTPTLAPEMEFKSESKIPAIDEYFKKFRDAGLKVGVCVRPQQIRWENGKPRQEGVDDEHAMQILKDKIKYARERWGCTLFYVDSTIIGLRPFAPDVFKTIAETYPDVLLIPEHASMRYFAYSSPLQSYFHHRITGTPKAARFVYPEAFSVLLLGSGTGPPEDRAALVESVRQGDILLVNAWYPNRGLKAVKDIYSQANSKPNGHAVN